VREVGSVPWPPLTYDLFDGGHRLACVWHVTLTGKHAMRCENLRDYCTNPACTHRPDYANPSASSAAEGCDENCEFNADDAEDMDLQADNFEYGELEMPTEMEEVLAVSAGGSGRTHGDAKPIRLYNWSAPQQWWCTLLQDVCGVGEPSKYKVGFVFSRTAHPGCIVAMRSLGMRVYSLKCGVSAHCAVHGEALMEKMLLASSVENARALVAPSAGEAEKRASLYTPMHHRSKGCSFSK